MHIIAKEVLIIQFEWRVDYTTEYNIILTSLGKEIHWPFSTLDFWLWLLVLLFIATYCLTYIKIQ